MQAVRRLQDPAESLHGCITWSDPCAATDSGPLHRCWPELKAIANLRLTSGRDPRRAWPPRSGRCCRAPSDTGGACWD